MFISRKKGQVQVMTSYECFIFLGSVNAGLNYDPLKKDGQNRQRNTFKSLVCRMATNVDIRRPT